jgi:hypothetical protein
MAGRGDQHPRLSDRPIIIEHQTEAVLLVVPNSEGSAGLHETLPRTHAQTAQRLPAGGLPQARTYAVLAWDGETRPESVGELRPHFPDSPRGAQMDLGSPGS